MSGNPNPQHVPTDGLGVAAYVQLAGGTGASALSNPSGGSLTHPGSNGANGQGIGATAGGVFPVAQYAITLSVSGAGSYETTAALTASLVDVENNPYDPSDLDQFTAISYNNPSAGSPAWYNPSNFAGYSADVASVSAAGISGSTASISITALHPGQAIVEVAFATFDNTLGNTAQPPADQPHDKIYVQVIVTVIP
jgi:hypothetical protein